MRVTQSAVDRGLVSWIGRNMEQLATLNEQLSTGRKINKFSDDPPSAGRLLDLERRNEILSAYLDNMHAAQTSMRAAASTLENVSETLSRIRQLAVQAASETYSDSDRKSIAEEVNALIDALLSQVNTENGGGYLFGGELNDRPPFVATRDAQGRVVSVDYQGAWQTTQAPIGPATSAEMNFVGGRIFTEGTDMFASLIALRNAIDSSDQQQIEVQLGNVRAAHDRIREWLGRLGARQNQVQLLSAATEALHAGNVEAASDLADADVAELIVRFNSLMAQMEALMRVAAESVTPSIFEYL